jgi:dTDP-3-amino-3,4,6-trideoxy-alpha-D-glucose transaminase
MRIPTADLQAQHAALWRPLEDAFQRVLRTAMFIGGPEVEAFEHAFAAYCGVQHVVGVANGTDALALLLRALGVGADAAVALPAFTFAATAEAVYHVGARPLLVDVDPATFTIDPESLRQAVHASALPVRAVIPVHLYGQAAGMDAVHAVARAAGAAVVEDAAQAHGARYRGRRVGGLGAGAAFSFYPTKNLGALGDAGAVTTDDAALAAHVALLRDHGQPGKYEHSAVGFNSRLDALQAAALRVKLPHLDEWNARRQAIAATYRERLHDVPGITLPATALDRDHVYHLYVVCCAQRDALRAHLAEEGIATAIHYPRPLHLQEAFAGLGYRAGDFPVAERLAREVLALPLYPELNDTAVAAVCDAVRAWSRQPVAPGRRLAR